ncbi:hypothetical protein [Sporosarcina ureae]|nr:hypothetical protein [Sporosarcina ureae]
MKKRFYISSVILSLGLLSACSAETETETEKTFIEQPSKSEGEILTD